MNLGRALLFGGLAGLMVASGYTVLIAIHVLAGQSGYSVHLGGSAIIIDGVPHVELPGFVLYVSVIGMILWGVFLSRVVAKSHRPAWWKAAPLMWLSIGGSLLVGALMGNHVGQIREYLVPAAAYASFGALFGWTLRSAGAAVVLFVACPVTYALALLVESVVPGGQIVGWLTTYPPSHVSFLHACEAFHQTTLWLFHGVAMGGVVRLVDCAFYGRETLV